MQERVKLLLDIIGIIVRKNVMIILNAINKLVDILFNISLITKSRRSSVLVHKVFVELLARQHQFWLSQVWAGELV